MSRVALGNAFPNALRKIRDEHFNSSTNYFAFTCGVPTSMMTLYMVRGKQGRFPSVSMMERMLISFDRETRCDLLKAYLADHVPVQYGHLVKICAPSKKKCVDPRPPKDVPEKTQKALERIAHYAPHSLELRQMIEGLDKIMYSFWR